MSVRDFAGAIACGRGAPWDQLVLVDVDGNESTAASIEHPHERHDDGWFYCWSWCGTLIRFILPPRLLPHSMTSRRTRLLARTIDGRFVGPFTIDPG